jgi:hypothetical protein
VLQLLLDGYSPGDGAPNVGRWISDFGLSVPVFDDGGMSVLPQYVDGSGSFGIPLFGVVGRDHTVQIWNYQGSPGPWSSVDSLLNAAPPSVDWPLPANAAALRSELGFGSSPWTGYREAL